jgi:hypothetical protein
MTRTECILRRELQRTMTDRQQGLLAVLDARSGLTIVEVGEAHGTSSACAHNLVRLMEARGYARVEKLNRKSTAHITDDGRAVLRLLSASDDDPPGLAYFTAMISLEPTP